MLRELKFVQGAVAKKDFIPAITHFCIENGTVRAYNGTIALCSPIACDLSFIPKAIPMVQAIGRCQDTISMQMTPGGRLSIRSGKFKALIDCIEESQSHVEPEGETIQFDGETLMNAIRTIQPFIGNDASRPWASGILLRGQSAFATNNVCLVEYWLGVEFPHVVNIPRAAINEMLRINEAPTHAQLTLDSITFHYAGGAWLRTQLYSTEWPDLARVLDIQDANPTPIPEELFEGLEIIKPFMDKLGRVFVDQDGLRTHELEAEGATYDLKWAESPSVFALEMLRLLKDVAKTADFNMHPAPCPFYGDRLRGAIIGMRL